MTPGPRTYRIAAIPGDGIGKEVTSAARSVLDRAASLSGFAIEWTLHDWSCERYLDTGEMMPADGLQVLSDSDAILLGAVGYPGVPDHISLWGLLIPIRRAFQQYVNLRPARLYKGVTPSLRDRPGGIDLVIVRENSEGEYSTIGGRHGTGTAEEFAVQESVFTRRGVERIVRFAFELAGTRRGVVTSATKSNGIVHTMPFWDDVAEEVASQYGDVQFERVHVDALAARLVLRPESLDVVVGSNLFGDILSDVAAAAVGGLGLAPSGNINPTREFPSMFESVHGSAPDIAGKGIANPIAQVLSSALLLRHLGEHGGAQLVETAVELVLAAGTTRTPDLGGSAGTREVEEALVGAVSRLALQ